MADGFLDNATVSAVLGGLSGGLVSWLISRGADKSSRIFSRYQAVESTIDELESVARVYWKKSGNIPTEESNIKSLLERLDLRVEALLREKKKPELNIRARNALDDLTDDITGGDFETLHRKREFVRAVNIKEKCSALRDMLHGN